MIGRRASARANIVGELTQKRHQIIPGTYIGKGKLTELTELCAAKDAEAVAGIEKKLSSHLGARVAVLHTAKKGRIVIEYQGNEDLQRLLEKLGVET